LRWLAYGFREHEGLGLLKKVPALLGDFQDGEGFRCLLEISAPDEFTADGCPFEAAMGFSLSIDDQLVMTPTTDFLRIRSSQDSYHVVKPDAKSAFPSYLFNAGENRTSRFPAVKGISG
jgi:hypothetical protein